ncbi:MAG: VOC family protein [Sphingomonadales bacterium]|nr:VOC family protein [Sphingomonadales bacterium]
MPLGPIRQVAYFCADIRAAALDHHRRFGSGPWFIADHIPLAASHHRGVATPFDHSSAYGQWGEVMIEFVQQNNSGGSAMRDLYPEGSGRWGLHHVAVFVDDVDGAAAQLAAEGYPTAQRSVMNDGFVFAFADTSAAYGHMIELYAPLPALTEFYAVVAAAARDFRGGDPFVSVSFD